MATTAAMYAQFRYTARLTVCYDRLLQYTRHAHYLPMDVAYEHIQTICQTISEFLQNHYAEVNEFLAYLGSTHDFLVCCIEQWTKFSKKQYHEGVIIHMTQLGQAIFNLLATIDRLITVLSKS